MKLRRAIWAAAVALSLMAIAPAATGHPNPSAAATAPTAIVPRALSGTVTNCTNSTVVCVYGFSISVGTGWANATVSSSFALRMALQLPGEAKASYNLSYSTYVARLTGTYTYWTVGNFLGTDVNSGHVVLGTTNTNVTITCHGHSGRGGGCTYTYTTDNGTIVVRSTNAEITSTSASCSPSSTHPGVKVSCTVTVTNGWNASNLPTGKVRISSGGTGTVSNRGTCTLANGTCSFTYRPSDNTCGTVALAVSFVGNAAFYRSSTSVLISVIASGGC